MENAYIFDKTNFNRAKNMRLLSSSWSDTTPVANVPWKPLINR